MSNKFRWLALYGFILLCAFAFGVGYGMAYEEAWAAPECNCTLICPPSCIGVGVWNDELHRCEWDPFVACAGCKCS